MSDAVEKKFGLNRSLVFLSITVGVFLFIYFISNYFWFRKQTAIHAVGLLNLLGQNKSVSVLDEKVWIILNPAIESIRKAAQTQSSTIGTYEITVNCTIVPIFGLFLGLVLATEAKLSDKLKSLIILALLLYFLNTLRLTLVIFFFEKGLAWKYAHDLTYNLGGVLIGVIGFYAISDLVPNLRRDILKLVEDVREKRLFSS
ncbi:MAG: hypothetical protein ACE5K0_00225 [Candidatus Methanofastidiosia archaeon]